MSSINSTRDGSLEVAVPDTNQGQVSDEHRSTLGRILPWLRVDRRGNVRFMISECAFNGLPFFGGLFAYAHAAPGMLEQMGIANLPWWITTGCYVLCLVKTYVIGVVIKRLSDEKRVEMGKRFKLSPRVTRLLSGFITLSGLFFSVTFPPAAALPLWPIVVMAVSLVIYEALHRWAKGGNDPASPDGENTPGSPTAAGEVVPFGPVGAGRRGTVSEQCDLDREAA